MPTVKGTQKVLRLAFEIATDQTRKIYIRPVLRVPSHAGSV